jgi:hypothetical protein
MGDGGELGDRLAVKFGMLLVHLDERARRLYLGSEALALEGELGRERALRVVAGAAGVSRTTVRAGAAELEAGAVPLGRVRRPGAGRSRAEDADPGLPEALISDDCRGDPMSPLKWTARSAESLARTLTSQGFVNVGTDHDTAAFATESIRRWWQSIGAHRYPAARRLLITADAGGSNDYRTRAWKSGLAAEVGLKITVCHFPPGTGPAPPNGTKSSTACSATSRGTGAPAR